MATGEIYQLIQEQTPYGLTAPVMLNVYYFRQTSGAGDWSDLATEWLATVLPDIVTIQSQSVETTGIVINNLDDPSDFGFTTAGAAGQGIQPGDVLPYYNAFKFIYIRTTRASRNGWKRFTGVPEAAQNGGILNGTYAGLAATLATTLESPLTDGGGNVWLPRIFRAADPGATPPVVRADFPVAQVQSRGLSTQNTRKK